MPAMHLPPAPEGDDLHPYALLTPDLVLDALASIGLYGDGRLMALGSYENRVYQVHLEDGTRVVAKFYRPGRWSEAQIQEEHAFSAELVAAEVPAVAPLVVEGRTLHTHAGFAFSVSPWRGGRTPDLEDFDTLEWIGRFLARIHTVGAARPFTHRPALDVRSFAIEPRDALLQAQAIPLDQQSAWAAACGDAIRVIEEKMAQGAAAHGPGLRLHGDCHPGNVLWTPADLPGGGPHFVDLDDARTGPAVQDLWMLLSGDRRQRTQQLSALLDGYEQFRDFDRRELALIEPLRTLRLIHYSAWLARRWSDPIFPINFPWFGSSDYWRGQVDMLREQIEAMQEEPLAA
ncbi:serine/threonine protein kinase [Paracidovorax cattleyae]|uniref:Stress response kinase A n=1 Tax=Paracidovorax cattleyae TaxID=80868 RepID=A0A1H0WPC0_9BURK|nr:serine/threonine protein kinase [Paracidovorax cattleyae]SDP92570.1 Ser/Thr protein kinase RdoA involved in Cpx stress response, MazF antagonist [Paracidovorax cattleyae]